jgi:hypothetical protein
MIALSIRQPYAEQILRGMKRYEYRPTRTRKQERVYIYAAMQPGELDDFAELGCEPGDLSTGVLVGSVEITDCTRNGRGWKWHLKRPHRLKRSLKPARHPQPSWFNPF